MNTQERIELFAEAFTADIIRAQDDKTAQVLMKTQMHEAGLEVFRVFGQRVVSSYGRKKGFLLLLKALRIVLKIDPQFNAVQKEMKLLITESGELAEHLSNKYLDKTDLDFNQKIDVLIQNRAKDSCCIHYACQQIIEDIMLEQGI